MTSNNWREESSVATLASLRTYEVSAVRVDRLRRRCHVLLQAQRRANRPDATAHSTSFWRLAAPVLGGAWCLAYLVEIIRRAAAVYG
jgi:hypothetical protein